MIFGIGFNNLSHIQKYLATFLSTHNLFIRLLKLNLFLAISFGILVYYFENFEILISFLTQLNVMV